MSNLKPDTIFISTSPILNENLKNNKRNDSRKNVDSIEVSTKTIIANTNLEIDLEKFFNFIPITNYVPIEKKRGRKKKSVIEIKPEILSEGSIISVQKGPKVRGVIIKKNKKKVDVITYFLHSAAVVMAIEENKFVNIKVSSNGKLQITGCKNDEQCFKVVCFLYKHIKNSESILGDKICKYKNLDNESKEQIINKDNNTFFEVIFDTVMQNMDFNIGFDISREKLNTFINSETNFTSIFEGSIGTGVNIKIDSRYPYEEYLTKMKYEYDNQTLNESINFSKIINKEFIENEMLVDENYNEYDYEYEEDEYKQIKNIKEQIWNDEKENKKKKIKKDKYHTFLVFASGSIIMSSRGPIMKEIFKELVDLLLENKKDIEETIKA